jgi:hypothetical protein
MNQHKEETKTETVSIEIILVMFPYHSHLFDQMRSALQMLCTTCQRLLSFLFLEI